MKAEAGCPRCGGALQAPGLWSSSWRCDSHGSVPPVQPVVQPTPDVLRAAAAADGVPLWMPWPLPRGWLFTGVVTAGDERSGARATAMACSGPAPLGGMGELVLVARRWASAWARGSPASTGRTRARARRRAPDAKVHAAGLPTAHVGPRPGPGPEAPAVYVGEALGYWVWAMLWPGAAGFLLIDDFVLTDLRDAGHEVDLPVRGTVATADGLTGPLRCAPSLGRCASTCTPTPPPPTAPTPPAELVATRPRRRAGRRRADRPRHHPRAGPRRPPRCRPG